MTIIRKMKKSYFFSGHSLFAGLCASFALSLVFALASCETGLGESIDVSVPTVSILQPASSSSISGDLVISGVANDDKSLSKVVLTIKNTATNQVSVQVAPITGTTWQVVLNKLGFKDGTYSVDVVAYDSAGRVSGTANRVFDIDNTPPVFCITKPNSLKISDPAPFGRDVTIKGEIADDHVVKQMDIRVFKSDGTEITGSLAKTSFTGFETAGGTEITIAKYFVDSEVPAQNSEDYPLYMNYKAMYNNLGAQMGDTTSLYIFPYLTDAAGNVSDKCYIQSSLKQLLSKACGVETTSDSLQTAQLKKILNGSYNLGEVNVDIVKAVLNGTYDQNANIGTLGKTYDYYSGLGLASALSGGQPLAMSLNANNSPTYEFGGYSFDKNNPKFTEVASGGTMSIKVSAGLDGNEVIANTVRVCLWECDDTLKIRDGANLNNPETASYYSGSSESSKKFSVTSNGTELADLPDTERVSTSTYSIALPSTLSAGVHYLLTATGVDVAGNSLYSTATYAFMVATTGDAPKVEFAEQFFINANAIDKTKNTVSPYKARIEIIDRTGTTNTGTIKESGNGVEVKPYLYKGYAKTKAYLSEVLDKNQPTVSYAGDDIHYKNGSSATGEYYIEVPMNIFDLTGNNACDNYTVALQVKAKNTGATSEQTTFIFWADKNAPVLEITSPGSGSTIFEDDKNIIDTTSQGATSKTYEYTPRGAWKDESGSGTCELWYAWDNPAAPVLTWTALTTGNAVEGVTYYTKQGGGDGVAGLYLADTAIVTGTSVAGKYTLSVGSDWTPIKDAPKSAGRANWNENIAVANSSGRKLNFVAVDQTGNISAVATVDNLTFDFAPPEITIPTIKEYYVENDATSGKYTFTINVVDASGLQSLDVTAKKNKDNNPTASGSSGYTLATASDKTSATITLTKGASDSKWSFNVSAKDKSGRESKADFAFTIDTVKPERVWHYTDSVDTSKNRMVTIGKSGSVNDWHNSESLTISGKFKEETSGLNKIVYAVKAHGAADYAEEQAEIKSGDKGSEVLYKISPIGFKEGTNSIKIYAVDLAKNESSPEYYDINIDITAPLVNTAWYTYDGTNINEAAGTVMSNGSLDMTVYGTLEETLSGIKSVDLAINGDSVLKGVEYTTASGLNQGADAAAKQATFTGVLWQSYENISDKKTITGFKAIIDKAKLAAITSGDVELFAVATDMAGNKTEQRKFVIHIDNDPPVITIMSPEAGSTVNGSVTFTGATDDPALSAVKAYWSVDGTSYTEIPSLEGTYSWNIKNFVLSSSDIAADKITFVNGDEYTGTAKDVWIKIEAVDKAANKSSKAQKYRVDPNGNRPKITLTTAELKDMTASKYAPYDSQKIEGTVEDDDGVDKLEYSIDNGSNWTEVPVTGGAWSISVPQDGQYAIKFRVTDKAGTAFTSTNGEKNIYLSPVLAGKDKTFSTDDTNLYLLVDTKRPEFEGLVYRTSDEASGTYEPVAGNDKLGVVGGQKKFVKLNFNAKDENGIGSVKLTLNGTSYTGTVGAYDSTSKTYPCEIKGVDVSKDTLASDVYSAKLEITGGFTGDLTTETLAFTVDNTPPDVKPLGPDENSVHGAVTVWGSVEGTNSMQYAITYTDYKANATFNPDGTVTDPSMINHDGTKKPAEFGAAYKDINGVGNNWFVYFDGEESTAEVSHDKTLEAYIIEKAVSANCSDNAIRIATVATIADQTFDGIVPIYIWIKAVDDVGNVYEKPHRINFDPQGGTPTVTIGNPEANGSTVGGEVKLYGGADCEEGEIKAVFLQIISAKHTMDGYSGGTDFGTATYDGNKVTEFTLKANDLDYLKAAGYKVYKMRDYPTLKEWTGSLASGEKTTDYGVLTEFKGSAWNLRINGNGEFNPTSGTNQLIVCAYAYNGSKMNLPIYRQMLVDADSPIIENMYLKQYNGSTLTASKAYTSGVYIKGDCYLEFDLNDQDKIAKVYLGQSDEDADKAKKAATANKDAGISYATPMTNAYHAKISLDTGSGVGSKYIYVIFSDNKDKPSTGTQAFTINYDNVKPVISSTSIASDVHNTDGFYSVGAKVTENADNGKNQSGFERFVIYFMRGNKVYDPMISKKKAGADNPDNYVDVSSLTKGDDDLYWFEKTVSRSDEKVLSFDGTDAHVHAGRLVKMGGVIYKIKSVSVVGSGAAATTTVTLYDNVEKTITTAYFAYGESIDNNKKETGNGSYSSADGYGFGYPTSITNEDGDGMEEWANIQGTVCNLSAQINSKNIPDGPINIYYTAFDAAGNFKSGSVLNAKVSNNAPRLANVIVASDYNYDGTYSEDESRSYFTADEKPASWKNAYSALTLGSSVLPWIAAKGAVRVTPEVLGGNGALTWTCKYAGSSTDSDAVALSDDTTEENKKRTVSVITLPKEKLKTAATGKGLYEISILDSTDGGAQKALINLYMKNDVNDDETPVAKTKRFFWKSLTDNSVYGSSSAQSQADLKGHIELATQPKVSGKIVIKGTAFDNAGIKELKLTIPGILNEATTVATCDIDETDLNNRWTQTGGDLAANGYHFALDTGSERYTNTGHFVSWTLELDTEKAKFGTNNLPAKADVNFVLGIVDKNSKTSSATTNTAMTVYATSDQAAAGKYYAEERFAADDFKADTMANADYSADEFKTIVAPATIADGVNEFTATPVNANYTIDIVPYITKVTTSLSAVDSTNGVTDRSSLGHYPIYVYKNSTKTKTDVSAKATPDKTESVKIYGFNLVGATYTKAGATTATGVYDATDSCVKLNSNEINPGAFALTVNGVGTLNNSNDNDAKGSYTTTTAIADGGTFSVYKNYINRQPNDANNNNLTDDVFFDKWELNNMAAAPMAGSADDPHMKIQPYVTSGNTTTGGKIGFAFSNGSSAFTMPNNTYSWTYWAYDYDRVRYIGLNYDPQGYAWAAASGQDTHSQGGDPFFMETTRNRQRGGNGNNAHAYSDVTTYSQWKLERICIGSANSIMQDRIQSPSFANTTSGVYLAYYYVGSTKAEIRFRAGESASASAGTAFGFFHNDGDSPISTYTTQHVQLVAGGTGTAAKAAAPYVSIAAIDGGASIADDVVVMVWHDGSKMLYGYLTDPSNTSRMGNTNASGWTIKEDILPGVTGEHCQIAVDHDGGVHIAAYDSNGADVWYAYLSKYNPDAAGCVKKVGKVDSYDSTGVYLTLDAALDANNNPAPQIGFFSMASNRPKYARWNAAKGSLKSAESIAGTDSSDSYTGNWEVSNIPTVSNVRKSNTASKVKQNVNVGVWKDSDGKVTTSQTGQSYCLGSATGGTSGTAANNNGDVYGNGTANAVLSYTYGTDSAAFIETAQRVGNND